MRIIVSDTPEDLAVTAADHLAELLTEGSQTFGLAGGSSPIATYRILRDHDLPWERVVCWLPDERWVPSDDNESNARMARAELTDHVPARLIAPDTTFADPAESAAAYQRMLESEFGEGPDGGGGGSGDGWGSGIVLLGMGPDGHTASLFPDTAVLDVEEAGYVVNWVDAQGSWRLTATVPLLRAASKLVFLVAGAAKAPMLRSILVDEKPYPARLVAEGAQDVTWLLDAEAAAEL